MNDPYLYPETNVLINLAGIQDKTELDEYENRLSQLAILSLYRTNKEIKSLSDVFGIHGVLFRDVYAWAGKPRFINIYKQEKVLNGLSVEYSQRLSINSEIRALDKRFLAKNSAFLRNALVLSCIGEYSEPEHLRNFLKTALTKDSINQTSKGKYSRIKGHDLRDYHYEEHRYKE